MGSGVKFEKITTIKDYKGVSYCASICRYIRTILGTQIINDQLVQETGDLIEQKIWYLWRKYVLDIGGNMGPVGAVRNTGFIPLLQREEREEN